MPPNESGNISEETHYEGYVKASWWFLTTLKYKNDVIHKFTNNFHHKGYVFYPRFTISSILHANSSLLID